VILYALATLWWLTAFRRLNKKKPSWFKWGWLLGGSIMMIYFFVAAILEAID
jgi:hypothetical protein